MATVVLATLRCNMKCAHCCFSCTENGVDMSKEVFTKSINIIRAVAMKTHWPQLVHIAGGEPTLHPELFDFIDMVSNEKQLFPMITTNGKRTHIARKLLDMALSGKIAACLSLDQFHERIDPALVADWRAAKAVCRWVGTGADGRAIPISTGRARENHITPALPETLFCVCSNMMITPDGSIFSCGCQQERFGTVFKPRIPYDYIQTAGKCVKQYNPSVWPAWKGPKPPVWQGWKGPYLQAV